MLLTVLVGILMIIAIVMIHECGHALAARLCGVGVGEFGFGFWKPRIKLFQIGSHPVYLCLWLVGGYVKIKSRDDKKTFHVEGKFFDDVTLWQKTFICISGILANLVSAVVLRIIFFIVAPEGMRVDSVFSLELSAAPVWYLMPVCALYEVVGVFILWLAEIPSFFLSIFFIPITLGGGATDTVSTAAAVHANFWECLGIVYYISVVGSALNMAPIYPLDGSMIVLSVLKKIVDRFLGKSRMGTWIIKGYRWLGWLVMIWITLRSLHMILSELGVFDFLRR